MSRYTYHNVHLIHTTLSDGRCNQLRHLTIPKVNVRIERCRELDLFQFGKLHVAVVAVAYSR